MPQIHNTEQQRLNLALSERQYLSRLRVADGQATLVVYGRQYGGLGTGRRFERRLWKRELEFDFKHGRLVSCSHPWRCMFLMWRVGFTSWKEGIRFNADV